MRRLSPNLCAGILGLVTEAFLASIVVICEMEARIGQIVGPDPSVAPWFLFVWLPHYPGLVLAKHLQIHEPLAFWLSAAISGILWSAVWLFAIKIWSYVSRDRKPPRLPR